MESSYSNTLLDSSYLGGANSIIDINEDTDLDSQKKELEELIKNVPYSLSVALIKITQLHNYEPMDIDTIYQKILPAFPLLRRNDGSKYQSHSVHTVRSAMVSNKLYTKNPDNKYVLNVPNALKIVKSIKLKKKVSTKEPQTKSITKSNGTNETITIYNPAKASSQKNIVQNLEKTEPFINYESQNIDTSNFIPNEAMSTVKQKKAKQMKIKEDKVDKNKVDNYEKTFTVLKNLLKESESDKMLASQINIDLTNINDVTKLKENKLNTDKMIGILCVFKYFKPFLERSFNSRHSQENILAKMMDLANDIHLMENTYRLGDA